MLLSLLYSWHFSDVRHEDQNEVLALRYRLYDEPVSDCIVFDILDCYSIPFTLPIIVIRATTSDRKINGKRKPQRDNMYKDVLH